MKTFVLSETTPAVTGTSVGGALRGLDKFREVIVHGVFTGATAGTLDITLQRRIEKAAEGTELWADWVSFAQLASTAAETKVTLSSKGTPTTLAVTAVAIDTAGDAAPALAAGEFIGGHPGDAIRAVYTLGAGVEVGAPVVIYATAIE